MKKKCQRSYTFLYHYAPTSSWVWQRLVQTMSIVRNLNTFKMGSVVELFQGVLIMVDASTCHNFNFDYYGSLSQGLFLGDQVLMDTSKIAKDHGGTRLERPKILHLCWEHA